jgi:hypothetical protein
LATLQLLRYALAQQPELPSFSAVGELKPRLGQRRWELPYELPWENPPEWGFAWFLRVSIGMLYI